MNTRLLDDDVQGLDDPLLHNEALDVSRDFHELRDRRRKIREEHVEIKANSLAGASMRNRR
jgi:hypothetical protein